MMMTHGKNGCQALPTMLGKLKRAIKVQESNKTKVASAVREI